MSNTGNPEVQMVACQVRSLYTKSDRILVEHDDNLSFAHLLAAKLKCGKNITMAKPTRIKAESEGMAAKGEDEAAKGKGKGKGKDEGESDRENFQQASGGRRFKRLKALGAKVLFETDLHNLCDKIVKEDYDKVVYVNRRKLNL
ncbi:hypothetical protein Hanom_Chr01g00063641 [Helianthus anomalus]